MNYWTFLRVGVPAIFRAGRYCFMDLTNICNAHCTMCSIWKEKPKRTIPLDVFEQIVDNLVRNNVRMLQLCGGEIFAIPNLDEYFHVLDKRPIFFALNSNGTLVTEKHAKHLGRINNFLGIAISIDHWDGKIWSKIRGLPHVKEQVEHAIYLFKKYRQYIVAETVLLKENMNDIEKVAEYVNEMGLLASFFIPVDIQDTPYKLGGERGTNLEKVEILRLLKEIVRLKSKYCILNSRRFFLDVIAQLEGSAPRYRCRAGNKIYWISHEGYIYPCPLRTSKRVYASDEDAFNKVDNRTGCAECLFQCEREPSVPYNGAGIAMRVAIEEARNILDFISNLTLKIM